MTKSNAIGNVGSCAKALIVVCFAGLLVLGGLDAALAKGPVPGMQSKKKEPPKEAESQEESNAKMPALKFKMKDIEGKEQDLTQYYGNVVLVVNVASYCGFTPQYKGLEAMYRKYKKKGLVILGIPANEFGKQEPGTDSEIMEFCSKKFDVTFPMFSKVVVKGEGICPLYKYLTSKETGHQFGGEIPWNFNKFLIDRSGHVVGRFEHRVAPNATEFVEAVEARLKVKRPADAPSAKTKKSGKKSKKQ